MEKIIVKGGKKLQGEVDISVAKNSVLPIIVATILNPTPIVRRCNCINKFIERIGMWSKFFTDNRWFNYRYI